MLNLDIQHQFWAFKHIVLENFEQMWHLHVHHYKEYSSIRYYTVAKSLFKFSHSP